MSVANVFDALRRGASSPAAEYPAEHVDDFGAEQQIPFHTITDRQENAGRVRSTGHEVSAGRNSILTPWCIHKTCHCVSERLSTSTVVITVT